MCSATQTVKCGVESSSPSSLASVSLSFRFHLYNFTFPLCCPDSPCCDTVSVHPTLYPWPFFTYVFTVFSLHLEVVLTHPIGYSRAPSAVNDPTVTKQVNSGKSCLEEVSQLLVYQVALINQYWVRLQGDFRRNKKSTTNLASFTNMKKNSFVSIVELLLLFLSNAAR